MGGSTVPLARILREHRLPAVAIAIVLAVNVAALVVGVLPLSRAVDSAGRRAAAAEAELAAAEADVAAAEATRAGKDQAAEDLQAFYTDVLPGGLSEARGLMHTSLAQLAAAEGVNYLRLSTATERPRNSRLERLRTTLTLSGSYDDIRRFIHAIETREEFVIVENMVLAEGSRAGGDDLALTLDLSTYYVSEPPDGR
jgi:Tfp pilus assembly protein PilO